MQFRETQPLATASRVVARISWSADEGRPAGARRVLPDGCTDLLVSREEGSDRITLEVFGVKSTALVVRSGRPVERLGIHLRPGAARRALGVAAAELRDASAPLEALWGSDTRQLEERLAAASSWNERCALLLAALQSGAGPLPPPWLDDGLQLLRARRGRLRASELARSLSVAVRTLERGFREHVGLGPKTFARILRFHAARDDLASGKPASEVALGAGYSDQPHMVREFRQIAGVSPTKMLAWKTVES